MTRVCKLKFEALERLFVVYMFLSSFPLIQSDIQQDFFIFFVSILQGKNV